MILPILYIMETAHRGRGVFTTESIPAGTTIEIAPVIVLNQTERALVDTTLLHDYIFEWGINEQEAAVGPWAMCLSTIIVRMRIANMIWTLNIKPSKFKQYVKLQWMKNYVLIITGMA